MTVFPARAGVIRLWRFPLLSVHVFPARAGVIPQFVCRACTYRRLSRTSGGDPIIDDAADRLDKSFPHERG